MSNLARAGVPAGDGPPHLERSARPSSLGPLVSLIIRALLGRRRSLGVALLAAMPVLAALVLAVGGGLGAPETVALDVFATLTLGLVIPLVALILGTGALGTHIDDGTIVYLLVKPVPRWAVILAAMLVAALATAALAVLATLPAGLLLLGSTVPELQAGMVLGSLVASVLYGTVFVTLSVFTGRALVVGLGYVLIWEGVVTSLLPGTQILSIREYALAMVSAVSTIDPTRQGSGVDPLVAAVLSCVVLVAAAGLASWRLARFEVSEAG